MNSETSNEIAADAKITVRNLTLGYGSIVLMRDLNFTVKRGDVFIIMGGSGCGKEHVAAQHDRSHRTEPTGKYSTKKQILPARVPKSGGVFFAASASCIRAAVFGVP